MDLVGKGRRGKDLELKNEMSLNMRRSLQKKLVADFFQNSNMRLLRAYVPTRMHFEVTLILQRGDGRGGDVAQWR